jgi:hypothetical protein
MNKNVIKVFIGYDKVESVSWHTMAHSILRQSTKPVCIIPINLNNLEGIYKRERNEKQSNEFSFSRFLVPYLSGFEGYAVFFDCDQLIRTDISKIFTVIDEQPRKAVYVVKHDYKPKDKIKFLNTVQHDYPRKNWSSVILWDCGHPSNKTVTTDYVNTASPKELHRFLWLKDDEIGELDKKWNWLVGEYENPPENVYNVHWTVGGPYFLEYQNVDFSEEWFREKARMEFCAQRL